MIVQFFNHGTGSSQSAINYLLNENDSEGNRREPQPEIYSGDPALTGFLIDNNPRKFKYSSGAIAFRDGEKPTDKQIEQIMKTFRETFCPDLGPDKVNMLVVKHQDKGNLELHILVPMMEMTTLKRFNINPPGKHNQQLCKDFSALWNHKLNYAQVIEDPLKAQFRQFDVKVDRTGQAKYSKESFSRIVAKKIRDGKINSRDELCGYLTNKGFTIARKGNDYISVKSPSQKKAIRMYGPIFTKSADYKELVKQADQALNNTKLNEFQYGNIVERMQVTREYRNNFNNKTYVPRKIRAHKGTKVYSNRNSPCLKPAQIKNIASEMQINDVLVKSESGPQVKANNQIEAIRNSNKTSSSTAPVNKVDRTFGVNKSLASLQGQIDAAHADLASATTLEDRIRAEQKLQELMAQRNRLLADLEEAKKSELNDQDFTRTKRPKIR